MFGTATQRDDSLLAGKQLDLAYMRFRLTFFASLLVSALIVAVLWSEVVHAKLLIWVTSFWLLMLLRHHSFRRYMQGRRDNLEEFVRWKNGFVLSATLSGALWGGSIFLLPSDQLDPAANLLIFVLAGVAAFASVSMATLPAAVVAFLLPELLPLAVWLFQSGDRIYYFLAGTVLLYLGMLLLLSRQMSKTILASFRTIEQNRILECALRESNQRMTDYFESAPGFCFTLQRNAQGHTVMSFASAGMAELFGLKRADVAESVAALAALYHPEDRERIFAEMERSGKTLTPCRAVFRARHPEKGEIWVEARSVPQRDQDGGMRWNGFMQDISEQKQAETLLKKREAEFRTLAENAPDPIYRYDRNCRRVYINPAVERMTGVPLSRILGKSPIEALPVPSVDAVNAQRAIRRVLDTGLPGELEVSFVAADGRSLTIHNMLVPELAPDGSVESVLCIGRDISSRKKMEDILLKSEVEYRTLAENTPDNVIRYDRDCRIRYINKNFETVLGVPIPYLLGKTSSEAFTDGLFDELERCIKGVIESGESTDYHILLPDVGAGERYHHIRLAPERDESGAVSGVLAIGRDVTESKKLEQELAAREREFRMLAENLPVAVIRYDAEYRRRYLNRAAERMLHGNAEELLGNVPGGPSVPATPAMIEHYRCRMAEVLATNTPLELEFVLDALPAEQQEHYEVRFMPEYGTDMKPEGVLAIWYDITERKCMEEELRLKERVLDQAHEGVYLIDERGSFVYVNDEACRALGYRREELLGMGVGDIDYAMSDKYSLAVGEKSREEGAFAFETQHRRRDGSLFPVEIQASALVYQGKHLGLALARDITGRQQAEAALEESDRLLRDVLQGIPDPVWMKDADGAFVVCNEGVARLFNMKVEEIIGKDDYDFFPREQAEFYQNKDRAALEAGHVLVNEEWWTFADNGEQALMETRKTPVRSPDGKLLGVLGVARDITVRKSIEKAFRDSENMLQEAQRIAHVGSWDVDMVNDKLIWSDEIFRIWEIDKTKFRADFAAFLETVHPEDRERVTRVYNEAVVNHTLYEVEHRLLFPDGRIKHILERGEPQYDAQGKPVRFIGTSLDITERKRLEETLAEREREFRSLAANLPDNIARWDAEGRYLYVNPIHERLLGMKMEELIGLSIPDSHVQVKAGVRQVAATGQAIHALRQSVMVGSVEALHDVSLVPEFDEAGKVVSVLGMGRDMTERYRMQEEIVAREAESRVLVESSPDAIVRYDRELRRVYINPAWERANGIPIEAARGKRPSELAGVVSRSVEEYEARLRQVLESGEPGEIEIGGKDHAGKMRHFAMRVVPEFGKDGKVMSLLTVARDITARKQMETQLANERATLRTFFGAMPSLAWMKDTEGRYLACNPMFEQLYGATEAAILGKTDFDFVDAELATFFRQKDKEAVATGKPCVNEEWVTFAGDGRRALIETVKSPVTDAEGRVVGVIGVAHDITERKHMEQVVRESRESLREAQRISHVGNWELDLASGALQWSDEIYRIFEIDPERFAASYEAFLNTIHPHDRDAVNNAYRASLENRAPYEIEHRLLFADGRIKYVHERCETHYAEDGTPVRSLGTVQDITGRKQAEVALLENLQRIAELNLHLEENTRVLEEQATEFEAQAVELEASQEQIKQTEAWYRSILHSAPDGMLVVDESGRIMQVNARLETLFGYEAGELPGCHVEVLLPPDARAAHVAWRDSFAAGGADSRRMAGIANNLRGFRKDGSAFPVDVSLSRLPEIDGKRSAICAAVRDISERQVLEAAREDALAEAQRLAQLRSAFMAQMSHELRTPLNGILGYTQNLLQGEALGEKQVAGLHIIRHSGEHLLTLINGILDHAAIEADKFELIPGDIELEPFLSTIIGIIRVRAEQKNIAFTCEADAGLPAVVRGDAQRLRQVLLNLLANAVKFTDHGQVILRVNCTPLSRMGFAVQDSGIGIGADQLENIFLPFEQAGETSRRAGGTGLGLAISRKLVRLMGGDIAVESQLGEGSIFSFEIEMAAVQSGASKVNAAALSEQAVTRVTQAKPLLLSPSRQELDILHGLVARGSMRDVLRHADHLAGADERYLPFVEQLRQLAKSFQTKALLRLVEQYRNQEETEQ